MFDGDPKRGDWRSFEPLRQRVDGFVKQHDAPIRGTHPAMSCRKPLMGDPGRNVHVRKGHGMTYCVQEVPEDVLDRVRFREGSEVLVVGGHFDHTRYVSSQSSQK